MDKEIRLTESQREFMERLFPAVQESLRRTFQRFVEQWGDELAQAALLEEQPYTADDLLRELQEGMGVACQEGNFAPLGEVLRRIGECIAQWALPFEAVTTLSGILSESIQAAASRMMGETLPGEIVALTFAIHDWESDCLFNGYFIAKEKLVEDRTLRLELSHQVAARVASMLDLNELLKQVVTLIKEQFGYYHVHVYAVEKDEGVARVLEGTGSVGQKLKERGHAVPLGKGVVGRTALLGESFLVDDVSQDPEWLPNPLLPETRSELAVPLKIGGEVIGVLDVQSDRPRGLRIEDLHTMETLGNQIAIAMQNALVFEDQLRRLREMNVLNTFSQAITRAQDEESILELVYQHVSEIMPSDEFYVAFYNPDQDEVVFAYLVHKGEVIPPERLPRRKSGNGLTEYVIHTRRPLLLDQDVNERARALGIEPVGPEAQSWLGVPIMAGDEVLGVLAVQNYEQPGVYDENHRRVLDTIAGQTAIALQNIRAFRRLENSLQETHLLLRLSRELATARSPESVAEAVTGALLNLGVHRSIVGLGEEYNEGGLPVRLRVIGTAGTRGKTSSLPSSFAYGDLEVLRRVLERGERVLIADLEQAELPEGDRTLFKALEARSLLCLPMSFGKQIVGVILLYWDYPHVLSDREIELYEAVVNQAAPVLQTLRALEQVQQMVEERTREVMVFQALAENALDAIAIADLEWKFQYANPTFYTLFGYDREKREIEGLSVTTVLFEDQAQDSEALLPQSLESGWSGELRTRRKDGTPIFTYVSIFPLRDEEGRVVSLGAFIRDITEEKRLEEERERLHQEMLEAQSRLIRELSSPLIPITEDILVLPLVGTIDSARAQNIMETLLKGIEREHAQVVIIDITGVPVVDTSVANYLLQATAAAELLGAQTILVGITPNVAQTIVELGVDLSSIVTRSSLQGGVEYALRLRGQRIAPIAS